MGLKIIRKSFTEDKSILGRFYFCDSIDELYNQKTGEFKKYKVKENTVLIDETAAYLISFGSRSMTIAHECVHAFYHRKAFQFAQMVSKGKGFIECLSNDLLVKDDYITPYEWMEIQANGIAPHILMPQKPFIEYANDLFSEFERLSISEKLNNIEDLINLIADKFGVTIYAARKRLIDIGYYIAIGAFNYADEYYVRPFTFKIGSLNTNETYTISYKDIYKVALNPSIASLLLTNEYEFVESHLCLNSKKYIEKDESGDNKLTEYARTHIDECCIKFKYAISKANAEDDDFGVKYYLCRDSSKEIEFDFEVAKNPRLIDTDARYDERYEIHNNNVDEVMEKIVNKPFGDIIAFLMEYLDITLQELEYESGLSERTIRRYTNGENKRAEKRTVVALLRALNLPWKICSYSCSQAGISFANGNAEDDALLFAMQNLRTASPNQVNSHMIKAGYLPLTNDE